jgi:hypothetical protein
MFPIASSIDGFRIAMAIIGVVAGLAATFGPALFAARWILAPIDRAAKHRQAPVRFSIGDFLCLFILIQIPLAVVFRIQYGIREASNSREESVVDIGLWILTAALWIVGTVIWYMGSRTLSKAGVAHGGLRFVYLGLILPLVYYGLLPFTILTVAGCSIFFEDEPIDWITTRGVSIWLLLGTLFGLSAWFTQWMLANHDQPPIDSTTPDAGSIDTSGQDSQFGAARLQ